MGDLIPQTARQQLMRQMPADAPYGIGLWPTGNGNEWACCLVGVSRAQAAKVLGQMAGNLEPELYVPADAANSDEGPPGEQASGEAVAGHEQHGVEEAAPSGVGRGATVSALPGREGPAPEPQ